MMSVCWRFFLLWLLGFLSFFCGFCLKKVLVFRCEMHNVGCCISLGSLCMKCTLLDFLGNRHPQATDFQRQQSAFLFPPKHLFVLQQPAHSLFGDRYIWRSSENFDSSSNFCMRICVFYSTLVCQWRHRDHPGQHPSENPRCPGQRWQS